MFAKEFRQAGHVRRFLVGETGDGGWEYRVEEDSRVLRRVCYTDWHRVERALTLIAIQVSDLKANGWRETLSPC